MKELGTDDQDHLRKGERVYLCSMDRGSFFFLDGTPASYGHNQSHTWQERGFKSSEDWESGNLPLQKNEYSSVATHTHQEHQDVIRRNNQGRELIFC